MNNTKSLINAVKYARKTGYLLHDLRDPDFYADDQVKSITELDRAFIDASNQLNMPFYLMAGYGESDDALTMSDQLADNLLEVDDSGAKFKLKEIYDTALPYMKVSMKKWQENLKPSQLMALERYWNNYAD